MAALARLALSPGEIEAMTRDLEQILAYVASLDALDTRGVEPDRSTASTCRPRCATTAPAPALDPELALGNAPAAQGTAFVVPKVLEEEG